MSHSTGPTVGRKGYFVHSAQDRFQPLRPLAGSTTGSVEFFTTTTSPTIEWLKNHAAGTPLS